MSTCVKDWGRGNIPENPQRQVEGTEGAVNWKKERCVRGGRREEDNWVRAEKGTRRRRVDPGGKEREI
jgi:hypothetical protein